MKQEKEGASFGELTNVSCENRIGLIVKKEADSFEGVGFMIYIVS
jgi:hypothetical protein